MRTASARTRRAACWGCLLALLLPTSAWLLGACSGLPPAGLVAPKLAVRDVSIVSFRGDELRLRVDVDGKHPSARGRAEFPITHLADDEPDHAAVLQCDEELLLDGDQLIGWLQARDVDLRSTEQDFLVQVRNHLEGRPVIRVRPDVDDALRAHEVIDAIYRSAASGVAVELDPSGAR